MAVLMLTSQATSRMPNVAQEITHSDEHLVERRITQKLYGTVAYIYSFESFEHHSTAWTAWHYPWKWWYLPSPITSMLAWSILTIFHLIITSVT